MFNRIIFISQRQRLFTSEWGQGEVAGSSPKPTGPQHPDASPQAGVEGRAGSSGRHKKLSSARPKWFCGTLLGRRVTITDVMSHFATKHIGKTAQKATSCKIHPFLIKANSQVKPNQC